MASQFTAPSLGEHAQSKAFCRGPSAASGAATHHNPSARLRNGEQVVP
ncbi:hypothetical protein DsansV1_C03g0024361 [Dioscorea sansibarensis]